MGITKSISKRIKKIGTGIRNRMDAWKGDKLRESFARFQKAYQLLTERRFQSRERQPVVVDATSEKFLEEVTETLRNDGICICRGWLSPDQVELARREMSQLESKWHQLFENQSERVNVEDPESEGTFIYGNFHQNKRLRVNFFKQKKAPSSVERLLNDERLQEIASRYFDAESQCSYVLAERLEPAPEGDRWHVDRIIDQLKAMVILTDVEMEQGPLRYKKETHRNPDGMTEIYHRVFKDGVDEAYPDNELVESLPGDILYGCGQAGDCVIFDTLGVHSGTQCLEGFRQAYVATFAGPTKKTEQLQRWSNQSWI